MQVSHTPLQAESQHTPSEQKPLGHWPSLVQGSPLPSANTRIAFAGSPAMTPPVAILVHGQDDPANASFYPFAVYSPEWQAMRWALAKGRPVRFIDLAAAHQLALRAEIRAQELGAQSAETAETAGDTSEEEVQESAATTDGLGNPEARRARVPKVQAPSALFSTSVALSGWSKAKGRSLA